MKNINTNSGYSEPIINNTFIVIGMGFSVILLFTVLLVHTFFFSEIIDWNQNNSIIKVIELELNKSLRPFLIVIFWSITVVLALKDFRKLIKNPKYSTLLTSKYFKHTPIATEATCIEHKDVIDIKKSFFPLFGNRHKQLHFSHLFLLIVIPISQIIFLMLYVLKVIYWTYLKKNFNKEVKFLFYSYIIVYKNESDVININLLTFNSYQTINGYLKKYFNTNISDLPINTTLVKSKGNNNGK